MDPRRLLIFRTVARAGSISAGARELGWTQPAVSQHLQALEREVGSALLVRGSGGVTLTEPGRALLAHADAVASRLQVAAAELADLAQLRAGTVRLAAFPSGAAVRVPPALERLRRIYPGVVVHLTEAEPPEALDAVRAGDVDVALVFGYDDDVAADTDLVLVPAGGDRSMLVLPREHQLATRRRPSLRALRSAEWIAGCERCRAHLLRSCAAAGFEPDVRHESDDYVVVQNLVAHGLGVSLLPRTALDAFQHPEVHVTAVEGVSPRQLYLAHRPGADAVPAVAAVLSQLVAFGTPSAARRAHSSGTPA
ncbi:LysR family transcriptional regulator [Arsenicicoccus piscis]|uniref:LysR family transcriptional regulator n=1 Tax=Arsenicicoccus piscis TaxID=673954 RepID=A0ABQ6HSG6_9MICO|nr:LysR family transcriptional regulator [Arsenicicoccus piscis]MCH8626734.1 LysR family transcriptional regulator [Arsenicicoccus piscis]GMA21415.1 LysR family transcriptional regulator [Arsenicicoccus piscis]